jgi:hypothetical protein
METVNPFFIIGAQRSGTTLLRLILNAHSKMAIPEEGTFWMPLIRARRRDYSRPIRGKLLNRYVEYIGRNSQFRAWKMDAGEMFKDILCRKEVTLRELMEALYLQYAQANGKLYWGDKTPSFFRMIDELSQIFPAAKFIHVVRDGRDVFLSLRNRDPRRNNIALAALEWKYKVLKARDSLSRLHSDRKIEVKYEEILAQPEDEIGELCKFVGVPFERGMLDYHASSGNFIGRQHSDLIFKPISMSNSGKWKAQLTPEEKQTFVCVASDCLNLLGYETACAARLQIKAKAKSMMKLGLGLPCRSMEVGLTIVRLGLSSRLGLATDAAGKGSE